MPVLPPGTILQLMYLRERLKKQRPGTFVEIGPGAGNISALLLSLGWRGTVYDLEASTATVLRERFHPEIEAGKYRVLHGDWLEEVESEHYDLVVSCMVMEHLDDVAERRFLDKARSVLRENGSMISIVPGSPAHWGIEDDIAGHVRRYTLLSAKQTLADAGWRVTHSCGLTFPLSNALLPLSNFLVRRNEGKKLSLSLLDRTKKSGIRNVPMKTTFPGFLTLLLNERVLWPLHLLQKLFGRSECALVLYVEAEPLAAGSRV